MTLTKDLEEELSASLGERCITKFIDDKELDSGELGLELEQTPLIARFHQLMNGAGRRNESNRETALTGREAERQAGMRLAGPARDSDIMPGIRTPENRIFYPFHPLCGKTVAIVRTHRFQGADVFVVLQPDGTLAHIPRWMMEETAARHSPGGAGWRGHQPYLLMQGVF